MVQMLKKLPATLETQVWTLFQEYSLEEDIATHFSIFACRIPYTEEPGGVTIPGVAKRD